jgi:mono/diheme cytochrome c family protein
MTGMPDSKTIVQHPNFVDRDYNEAVTGDEMTERVWNRLCVRGCPVARRKTVRNLALVIAVALIMTIAMTGVATAAGDAAAGKEVFAKKCASCHGAGGEGKDAIAKMMKVEMKHLGSKEVQAKSDAELAKICKDGVGKMKPTAGLTDKDSADIVAYLRTLAKK